MIIHQISEIKYKSIIHAHVGKTGDLVMNSVADRESDFWLWQFGPGAEEFDNSVEIQMNQPTQKVGKSC